MKTFFSLALLALAQATLLGASSADLQSEFLGWKASPAGQLAYENGYVPSAAGRRYKANSEVASLPTAEELERFQNAKATIAKLQLEQPHAVFSLDSPFALLTAAEFQAYVAKNQVPGNPQPRALAAKQHGAAAAADIPFRNTTTFSTADDVRRSLHAQGDVVDIDWASKGCVSAPIDQGPCQASWAISAVGALEGAHCINTGQLVKLSSQEVISCGTNGQNTCSKGVSARAFDWVSHLNGGGLCTEESYPYASSGGVAPSCRKTSDASFSCDKVNVGANFYEVQNFRDHTQLERAVLTQPVAALVNSGSQYFQFFKGGVLTGNEASCPSKQVDSSVLVVGYGTLDGVKYWKIRNSWSTYWGDGGYAYIERGFQGAESGACGIETLGYYPVITPVSRPGSDMRCSAIRERVEIIGPTLLTVRGVLKPQDCCDRCRREAECSAYVWRYESDTCELKSSIDGEVLNAPGAFPTYSGTVLSKVDRLAQGTYENNADYPGNDIFAARARDATECMDFCNEYAACHAFSWTTYLGGMCYLKSKRPIEPKPVAANGDGTPSIISGTSYKCTQLLDQTDLAGTDLTGVPAPSAKHCCGICRATDKCGAFSWNNYNGGTCWLKEAGATRKYGDGVVSAFLR